LKRKTIVIGSGPAGAFCARELALSGEEVLVIDRGKDLEDRIVKGQATDIRGFLGSGVVSDGKITLSPNIGGNLAEIVGFSKTKLLIEYMDNVFVSHGALDNILEPEKSYMTQVTREAGKYGFKLINDHRIRHLGSDGSVIVARNLRKEMEDLGVSFLFKCEFVGVKKEGNKFFVNCVKDDEQNFIEECDKLVVATGRSGSGVTAEILQKAGVQLSGSPIAIDVGVRCEIPDYTIAHYTERMREMKLIYYSKTTDSKVRSFCVCGPGAHTSIETHDDNGDLFYTVNGFSNLKPEGNVSNFSILVTEHLDQPLKSPYEFGKRICQINNLLAGDKNILIQRYADLRRGRRSTHKRIERLSYTPTLIEEVSPGDISLAIPQRFLVAISEFIEAANNIMPALIDQACLLSPEIKLYSTSYNLSNNLETNIPSLYCCGDSSGCTKSITQASVSGIIVARDILSK